MKSAAGMLDWQLFVECPYCGESFDIVEQDIDDDNFIATAIFTNAWRRLKGYELECPKCAREFQIDEIEY